MNKDLNESYAGTIKTVSDLLIAAKQGYDEEKGDCNGTVMRFSTCDARLRNSAIHVAYSREPQSMRYIRRGLRNLYYATIYPTEIYKVPFDIFRLSVELPIQKHTDTS